MAASLAVIIFYAVVPQKFSVGDFSVKKIGLLQFKKQEHPLAKARPTTSRRRVKNHKFLFIGDSMVEGPVGWEIMPKRMDIPSIL